MARDVRASIFEKSGKMAEIHCTELFFAALSDMCLVGKFNFDRKNPKSAKIRFGICGAKFGGDRDRFDESI